jgi:hypothetical protein
MAKRLDDTQGFINTVLSEANWTQANIKLKLNEEEDKTEEGEDEEEEGDDDEEVNDSTDYTLSYANCPLCESELEDDDAIFENIDSHFVNLLDLVEQVETIAESDDYDGNEIIIESNDIHNCPLCESEIEDDSVVIDNMNEHFDVVLEMLDELVEAKTPEEKAAKARVMRAQDDQFTAHTDTAIYGKKSPQAKKTRGEAAKSLKAAMGDIRKYRNQK